MELDIQKMAMWASALIAIISFAKLVVGPFQKVMADNKKAMRSLEVTISELSRDLADSQKDRANIHKILDKHGNRLDKVEDEVIRIDTYCNARK